MIKIINFKTVSPLFEMERDGIKPFTERLYDYSDKRFRALVQWTEKCGWAIRITNPDTGESFIRRIKNYGFLLWEEGGFRNKTMVWQTLNICENWRIIILGELILENTRL